MNPPAAVIAAVTTATSDRPTSWLHVVAGHTHAEKWLVELADGRSAFVKAATQTSARRQIEREASILESVAAPYMPRLYGATSADEWSVLVLEDLSRAQWPPPYRDRGAALLETVTQVGATVPPHGLHRRPEGRPLGTYWNESQPIQNLSSPTDSSRPNGSRSRSRSSKQPSRRRSSRATTSSTTTSGPRTSATRNAARS